ncbi:MAG TPA: saccharopine dehydrogenase C-terminal domain-containing protein [Gammaproteobacteria bacterium]|nr:saccharopine dehydrogenase C-terminal domain-containing protein [Gammaproteobacteria bacterium]
MHRVLIVGAGKIGSLIASLLSHSNDYRIFLSDIHADSSRLQKLFSNTSHLELVKLDAENSETLSEFLRKNPADSIISSLPYYHNIAIANLAKKFNLNYFDLTEDTKIAHAVTKLSKNSNKAFVPQCGLAPGFISIVANDLMRHFPKLDTVKMRVGALPLNISNALQYSLTWSTDGLINEYGNLCQAIVNGEEVYLMPLDDLEEIKIDGLTYEAFNTSGGIGSLATSYQGKVKNINYKTIRYPGHCEKMRFLMNDLNLNFDRETLKRILENSLPSTVQDVVLVYVSVTGTQDGLFREKNYVKKFYSKKINNNRWSAIQLTTASAICAVVDIVVTHPDKFKGFVKQEQFSLDDLIQNRFGQYYA